MATESYSTDWQSMGDPAIVTELGAILKQIRLQQNLSQEKLAARAGLSRSAIHELENGKTATSLITIVQVLRALQQLQVFDSWKSENRETPLRIGLLNSKVRLRASRKTIQPKKEENEWEWL